MKQGIEKKTISGSIILGEVLISGGSTEFRGSTGKGLEVRSWLVVQWTKLRTHHRYQGKLGLSPLQLSLITSPETFLTLSTHLLSLLCPSLPSLVCPWQSGRSASNTETKTNPSPLPSAWKLSPCSSPGFSHFHSPSRTLNKPGSLMSRSPTPTATHSCASH